MIQIRQIRLRSITAENIYGVDLSLDTGLNVIQANNTSGKSTALMSILYALGLERAIGPKLSVPLPYAMREKIQKEKDGPYDNVLESYVMLELENHAGERLTVKRGITGSLDQKLVQTWSASIEDVDQGVGEQQDYFLFDAGSATREAGFHHRLAIFIGWELPLVPRFDGEEGLLYIETLFPMFFVEQKRGWSAVQGPFPTYLGIQDLPRRVMEFILNLDAGIVRRRRSELRKEQTLLQARYRELRKEIIEGKTSLVRIDGLPRDPSAEFAQNGEVSLSVYHEDEWQTLEVITDAVRKRIASFDKTEFEIVDNVDADLKQKLKEAEARYAEVGSNTQILRQDFQLAQSEFQAFHERVSTLEVDLKRNQDALKLQRLGSILGSAATDQSCPTCQQGVATELLPTVSRKAMGLEENIVFIRSQLDLYRSMLGSAGDTVDLIQLRYQSVRDGVQEERANIRSLKRDLLRPGKSSSRSELELIVRLEIKLERWKSQQEQTDGTIDGLKELSKQWALITQELKDLGPGRLTNSDREKINFFQETLQSLLRTYSFQSFPPTDITLSQDDFRPQVIVEDDDGNSITRDIGFEASASDGIRLKWAYILAALSVSERYSTHHIGFSIFDEPGQQQMAELDLASFFASSARKAGSKRQVLVTTSEQLARVEDALSSITTPTKIHAFDNFLLKPLP